MQRRRWRLCQLVVLTEGVVAIPHSEAVAARLIVAESVLGRLGGSVALRRLRPAIEDVGGHAVPGEQPGVAVLGGRRPAAGHHGVARRTRRRHPEPDGRLESDDGIGRHQVRVAQQVQPQRPPYLPVIVLAAIVNRA